MLKLLRSRNPPAFLSYNDFKTAYNIQYTSSTIRGTSVTAFKEWFDASNSFDIKSYIDDYNQELLIEKNKRASKWYRNNIISGTYATAISGTCLKIIDYDIKKLNPIRQKNGYFCSVANPWHRGYTIPEEYFEAELGNKDYFTRFGVNVCDSALCAVAARGNQFELVKYFIERGMTSHFLVSTWAACAGNVEMLDYLFQHEYPIYSCAYYEAIHGNYIDCIKYLISKKITMDSYVLEYAAKYSSVAVMELLYNNNCLTDGIVAEYAIKAMDPSTSIIKIMWCAKRGLECNGERLFEVAKYSNRQDICNWLSSDKNKYYINTHLR
jgi:hypothetical protein